MSRAVPIEKADLVDAESILKILQDSWIDTYVNEEQGITEDDIRTKEFFTTPNEYLEKIRKNISNYYIVRNEVGEIAGFTAPKTVKGENRLGKLYVRKQDRGKGIGGALLKHAISLFPGQPIYIEVVEYNQTAIDFYKRYGFRFVDSNTKIYYWVSATKYFAALKMARS